MVQAGLLGKKCCSVEKEESSLGWGSEGDGIESGLRWVVKEEGGLWGVVTTSSLSSFSACTHLGGWTQGAVLRVYVFGGEFLSQCFCLFIPSFPRTSFPFPLVRGS